MRKRWTIDTNKRRASRVANVFPMQVREPAPKGELTLQTVAMPADTNASGDIFGGWLLAQMDLGSAVLARERAEGRVATVAVEAMSFHRPVRVGDLVSIYATVLREGATATEEELRGHCAERLARFKVPKTFAFVDALPRSSMGKILKDELRAGHTGVTR